MSRLTSESIAFGGAVRKEWQVIKRYPVNIVTMLVMSVMIPAAYLAQAMGFAGDSEATVAAFESRSGTDEIAGFIYLGFAIYLWINLMIWGPGMSLREERLQGSLENVFLTPVSRFTLLFGPATAQMIPAAMLFVVVGLMLRFVFGVELGWQNLAGGLVVLVAAVPSLLGMGAIVAVSALRFRDAEGVTAAAQGILSILCGITFPIAVLPEWIQPVSWMLPPTQILAGLRGAILGPVGLDDLWGRTLLLLGMGAALGLLALLVLDRSLRATRRHGRLEQF